VHTATFISPHSLWPITLITTSQRPQHHTPTALRQLSRLSPRSLRQPPPLSGTTTCFACLLAGLSFVTFSPVVARPAPFHQRSPWPEMLHFVGVQAYNCDARPTPACCRACTVPCARNPGRSANDRHADETYPRINAYMRTCIHGCVLACVRVCICNMHVFKCT